MQTRRALIKTASQNGSGGSSPQCWHSLYFFLNAAGDIVQKVLENFSGILGCDGWATYKVFSKKRSILLQRCWAHLIREVKETCKDVKGLNDAYVWICDMFDDVQRLRKIKSKKRRQ